MSVDTEATEFSSMVEPDTAEVAKTRHRFCAWLQQAKVPDEDASDLATAFSELVTNAAAASRGTTEPVTSRAWIEADTVVLEVANTVTSPADFRVSRWDLDDPLRPGGRGLMIVQAFTDDLEIDVRGRTLLVRCRRHVRR